MMSSLLTSQRAMLALIQSGLAYTTDPFDQDRYQKLQTLLIQQMATTSNLSVATLTTMLTQDTGYVTPKLDVRGLIRHGNQLLLVQDIKTKLWALPGGFADVGYTPTENVAREVWEETGRHVNVQGLLTIFDTALRVDIPQPFQYYKLVFACEITDGHFEPNIEVAQTAYFTLDNLPPLSKNRTTKEQLHQLMGCAEAVKVD
ncbi:NUDIX hydrolase N-terminal domain-containing protein [Lactiplantibacillus paraplantarum]|uniref:NUDIX domain-containing protein n=1 Tax=Lactiplantibacillus paraplantarum TaxID=60520 RepID=A0A4Q9Y173_9LACO|nr:NUDIX hydrolase N-terminal domain-containing protein [Lactiplantibacillus paraplantarum]TBX42461.1 NUDIX domain-containing protein [Lactiplantibacillus paraplantarum]WEE37453.1 NUDIX hydrolase N-terminal domain-containing protein [Lactiplantibacillus paraplantarum]